LLKEYGEHWFYWSRSTFRRERNVRIASIFGIFKTSN